MKIKLICLIILISTTSNFGMQAKKYPPAKTGLANGLNFASKIIGSYDVINEETKEILAKFTDDIAQSTLHELVEDPNFIFNAKRTAQRLYYINLRIIETMAENKPATIRELLALCQNCTTFTDAGLSYLAEENEDNKSFVDPKQEPKEAVN